MDEINGDVEKGKEIFVERCAYCHSVVEPLEDSEQGGPNLHGIFGRKSGQASGFEYSDAIREKNITWNEETLFQYLTNPQKYIPGSKLFFPGLENPKECNNVISYLKDATK